MTSRNLSRVNCACAKKYRKMNVFVLKLVLNYTYGCFFVKFGYYWSDSLQWRVRWVNCYLSLRFFVGPTQHTLPNGRGEGGWFGPAAGPSRRFDWGCHLHLKGGCDRTDPIIPWNIYIVAGVASWACYCWGEGGEKLLISFTCFSYHPQNAYSPGKYFASNISIF